VYLRRLRRDKGRHGEQNAREQRPRPPPTRRKRPVGQGQSPDMVRAATRAVRGGGSEAQGVPPSRPPWGVLPWPEPAPCPSRHGPGGAPGSFLRPPRHLVRWPPWVGQGPRPGATRRPFAGREDAPPRDAGKQPRGGPGPRVGRPRTTRHSQARGTGARGERADAGGVRALPAAGHGLWRPGAAIDRNGGGDPGPHESRRLGYSHPPWFTGFS
jgi:hypothetical protein